ncbi:centriole, cilia and spindle-associated protein isoform X2 [Hemicordylus capensis]|uniref:centriole, cilia and spindle-associated protein isoform X2 n=1 Tax=Hemicordylus capensis TaxID=884348 RepID=UPI00230316DB|nr:centriole, cilia and spindle-associated protein isoform X2 [Hemicordylus capensis]
MVPSRCVKSEYMKRFKEPKWEACGPCYQELLRYRLSRRLLEQAHRPWFWDGWEQDSSLSSGGSGGSPSPPEEDDDQEKADIKEAEGKSPVKGTDNSTSRQQGRPPSRSVLGSQGDRRPAKSPPRTDTAKGAKHPFALYGWGEKQTDTGSQKTHNVCASASANEIHESALRAKNRRQMEKRKLSQRQINSAEVERTWRAKSSGPDNPWMTEYMRCYSARAR